MLLIYLQLQRKHRNTAGGEAVVGELRRAFEAAERGAPHITQAFVHHLLQRLATPHSTPHHWLRFVY